MSSLELSLLDFSGTDSFLSGLSHLHFVAICGFSFELSHLFVAGTEFFLPFNCAGIDSFPVELSRLTL